MSDHQLGMRTGVMKHGYVHFLCTIVSSIRFACFLSWLCRGYTLAALGCDSSRIPLEIFVSFLAATDFTIFLKHFNFPRLMFFVPRGGRPARTLGVGRSVRLSSLGSSASILNFLWIRGGPFSGRGGLICAAGAPPGVQCGFG